MISLIISQACAASGTRVRRTCSTSTARLRASTTTWMRSRNKRTHGPRWRKAGHAFLSQKLARIMTDVPVDFDLERCRRRGYDRERCMAMFQELSFRCLVDRLPPAAPAGRQARRRSAAGGRRGWAGGSLKPEPAGEGQMRLFADGQAPGRQPGAAAAACRAGLEGDYTLVVDEAALTTGRRAAAGAPHHRLRYRDNRHRPARLRPGRLSRGLGHGMGQAAYIPVLCPEESRSALGTGGKLRCGPSLPMPKIRKIAHNAGFDLALAQRNGVQVSGEVLDTMVAEFLLDPGGHSLGLKDIAWTRLQIEMTRITDLIGDRQEPDHHGSGAGRGGRRAMRPPTSSSPCAWPRCSCPSSSRRG